MAGAWVIVIRGVDAPSAEAINEVAARARHALDLPCTGGTVIVKEWMFDDATGRKLREERAA